MREVRVGKVYRHFKGNYYFVENVGRDSETNGKVVIYKRIYESSDDLGYIWVRPADMFLEEIDVNRPDNITGQKYRFEMIEELSKDFTK